MSEIPNDVWACGYEMRLIRDGQPASFVTAFLVRAGSPVEADEKVRAIFRHDAERVGAVSGTCFRNRNPGVSIKLPRAAAFTFRTPGAAH